LSGQVANQRLVELTTVEEHGEFYEDAGEFLPVGVWAARGFDAESIVNKSLPKDKKMHPVLGETFRVCVLRKGHRGAKTVAKSDKLVATGSMLGSSGDNPQLALEASAPQLALENKSDSDSDSSSSSSRKKSKKSKKAAKKSRKAEKKLKRKRSSSPPKASLSSSCFWVLASLSDRVAERPCRCMIVQS
jgi:hypothetical protein